MTSAGSGLSGVTVLRIRVVTGGGDWHLDILPPTIPEIQRNTIKVLISLCKLNLSKKKKNTKVTKQKI